MFNFQISYLIISMFATGVHFHTPREHQNKVYKEPQEDARSGAAELLWKGGGGGGGGVTSDSKLGGWKHFFSETLYNFQKKCVCVCVWSPSSPSPSTGPEGVYCTDWLVTMAKINDPSANKYRAC